MFSTNTLEWKVNWHLPGYARLLLIISHSHIPSSYWLEFEHLLCVAKLEWRFLFSDLLCMVPSLLKSLLFNIQELFMILITVPHSPAGSLRVINVQCSSVFTPCSWKYNFPQFPATNQRSGVSPWNEFWERGRKTMSRSSLSRAELEAPERKLVLYHGMRKSRFHVRKKG